MSNGSEWAKIKTKRFSPAAEEQWKTMGVPSQVSPEAKQAAEKEIHNVASESIEGCEPVGYFAKQSIDAATAKEQEISKEWFDKWGEEKAATAKLREAIQEALDTDDWT